MGDFRTKNTKKLTHLAILVRCRVILWNPEITQSICRAPISLHFHLSLYLLAPLLRAGFSFAGLVQVVHSLGIQPAELGTVFL